MSARDQAETALANGLADPGAGKAANLAALGVGFAILELADAVRSASRGGSHNGPSRP